MQAATPPTHALLRVSGLVLGPIAIVASIVGCGSKDSEHSPPSAQVRFVPQPGTYDYSTSGFERADLLLGVRNRYPAITQIHVSRRPCGYSERWSAGQQRRMRFDYCVGADGSRQLVGLVDSHEFLGYPVTLSYRCEGARVPNLARIRRSFSWTDRCKARTTSLVLRGSVSGRERIAVDGTAFDVVHLHVVARFRGRNTGRSINDSWLSVPNGLLVKRVATGHAKTKTPVGEAISGERFRLRLRLPDQRPQRPSTAGGA